MPQPAILDRLGFAPFDEQGLPHGLIEAVKYARQRATLLLAPLPGKRAAVLSNKNLSANGQAADLKELQRITDIDLQNTYAHAHERAQAVVDDCNRKLSGRLFHEVDGNEASRRDALATARAELFELARDARREANGAGFALDTSSGVALLPSGNTAHRMIHQIISTAPLAEARLLALAVVRSGAIGRHLLGGEAVERAVVDALTSRVTQEDPLAADLVETRSQGELVLAVVKGDKHTAAAALTKATRLDGSAAPARHEDDE